MPATMTRKKAAGSSMTAKAVLAQLKKLGTAQTRKTWERHGVRMPMFGTRFGDMYKIAKKIKIDHSLAESLWKTRNLEAMLVATMIADPQRMTSSQIDTWLKQSGWFMVADYLAQLAAKTKFADAKMKKWMKSKDDHIRQTGYVLLGQRLREDAASISAAAAKKILATIEKELQKSPNRSRYAMNNALIAIGTYLPSLEKAAIAAARKIGKVEVDHGPTACKTPVAEEYIKKARKRRK